MGGEKQMSGVNKALIVGRLGQDPIIKYTDGGLAIANFSLATSESFKNKDGEKEEKTEWHNIVAFGKLAEVCGEYLTKGKQIYLEGRLQTSNWEKEGVKHYKTEIVASNMQMLGSKGDDSPRASETATMPDSDPIPF